jgi:large subunit ribosomal protein L29
VKTKELRECNDERLEELEKTLRRQIFEARIKNFTNQLDDTASLSRARRELARVKTLITERAIAAEAASPAGESEGA